MKNCVLILILLTLHVNMILLRKGHFYNDNLESAVALKRQGVLFV